MTDEIITKHDAIQAVRHARAKGLDAVQYIENIKPFSGWIPVSERMSEEREWVGTKLLGTTISDEVYVTFKTPDGQYFTRNLAFQNGKVSTFDQGTINAFFKGSTPIA